MNNLTPTYALVEPLGLDQVSLREPDAARIQAFRALQAGLALSYGPVGATRSTAPEGWHHDALDVVVGPAARFDAARDALRRWVMFDLGWVRVHAGSGQREGDLVSFHSRQLGVWMLHACRVVYVVDEPDRSGFAYGTLRGHAVAGEEQFLVRRVGGETRFSVRKFSRLRHPLARLGGPVARAVQHRFSVDAAARMQRELGALRSA